MEESKIEIDWRPFHEIAGLITTVYIGNNTVIYKTGDGETAEYYIKRNSEALTVQISFYNIEALTAYDKRKG